jgi:hypothetical protein
VVATITRTIRVAAGVFAPGHLGELTSIVPFELVDDLLAQALAGQRIRVRDLPHRAGVYFLLAMCLFPEVGYQQVWAKLVHGLEGLPVVSPTTKALRDLRRRVPVAAVRSLFLVLAGPLAQPRTTGVSWRGYRTVSFDGCTSGKVADSERNRPGWARTRDRDTRTEAVIALYDERWEHESAYYALRHTLLDGRILRSKDPVGVRQEMWALLTI